MTKLFDLLKGLVEQLAEAPGRAQAHERDRYVDAALNARDASQRIHRLEYDSGCLQP
ncbi:MAG TPA: hypothetical protein VMK32_05225 [Burkholderiaceae bacterium]|nr:hypothetical protein [Burkholderiaceae bacterium]